MYKEEDKKRLIVSLGISLFLLVTLIFPFFVNINQKQSLVYYPLTETILEDSANTVRFSGYDKEKNEFKTTNGDPSMYLCASEDFNKVNIVFTEKLNSSISIQVFYSNSSDFYEEQSVNYTLEKGERNALLELDNAYSNVRIDIGDVQGIEFNLDKIELTNAGSVASVCLQSIIMGVMIFILCVFLSRTPGFAEKTRKLYKNDFIQNHLTLIQGLLIMTFIFSILYFKYIYLGEAYMFSNGDICGDTLDGIYPTYHLFSKFLHEGNLSLYSLQSGFGTNYISVISLLFQPFDLVTVLFPIHKIEIGIIISVYIRLCFIITFAVKYFMLVFKDKRTSIICSLLWTFCSYIIIWGQQYGFASNMVYFTAFSYYFHKLCMNEKLNIGLVITLAFISFAGYYFFYSVGVYSMFYLIIFYYIYKIKVRELLKIVVRLAGATILAIGLTAFILLPNIFVFLNSARTGTFSNVSISLFSIVDIETMISMIGRFLSPNLLGTALDGAQYSTTNASLNYYEMAFLSVGLVSLFAINYYVLLRKVKKSTILFILILLGTSLMTYIVSYVITFGYNFRWTFMLLFLQILLIGNYMKFILYNYNSKVALIVNIRTLFTYTVLSVILVIADKCDIINLNYLIFFVLWIFIILYVIFTSSKNMKSLFITAIVVEIVVQGYAPISIRGTEKIADLHHKYYYDGTIESVEKINNNDSSIYRVNKSFISRFFNDAQVQGYNGMSIYNSVNSKDLQKLLKVYGIKESYNHPNYFKVDYDDLLLNGLFGVKYIISDEPLNSMKQLYEGEYPVYENPYCLPFGFLYDQRIDVSNVDIKDLAEYTFLGYYDETYKGNLLNETLSKSTNGEFIRKSKNEFSLHIQHSEISNYNSISALYEAEKDSITTAYVKIDGQVEKQFRFTTHAGKNEVKIDLPYMETVEDVEIKIEVVEDVGLTKVDYVIKAYEQDKLMSTISTFRDQALENIQYQGDFIGGKITNNSKQDKMLFIPIVYSDEWIMYIDGEEREIKKINGGFIGSMVEPGVHEVELNFTPQGLAEGCKISLITILCVGIWGVKWCINNSKKLKRLNGRQ